MTDRDQPTGRLPIQAHRADILEAIREHPVVIVAGETGSGKSTQLPQMCLEAGLGTAGLIGHTQPRRIAARAVAERLAQELRTEIGGLVGYTVRFTDRVREGTRVRVMTDGILLAELARDRRLERYDALIVDEAHERSLNIDFILGYLKRLGRTDLKVIVTSATIDTDRLSQHFGDAPVIEIEGRSHPVEIRYRPPGEDADQPQSIRDAVEELWTEGPGDILVFVSGEREIRDAADAVRGLALPDTEIVPLYARLSAAEQHRVFTPHRGRRVVIATNVAETSITVPGIRYVVDAGTARISRYSHRTKVQRLPIEAVSQASAKQRAGRCGRVAPGVCIRLYAEEDFNQRPVFTEPEILRTNLASVILQMAGLGLGDVHDFPFVDPPDRRNVADGVALLEELRAFERGAITPLGRRLARLPVDPRLGRMVLEAEKRGCVREVTVIAAFLSIQDPRDRRNEVEADSDFVAILDLWNRLETQPLRRLCREESLSYVRMREWQDVTTQLREVARIPLNPKPADPTASVLSGLLSHIGLRDGYEYIGARGARFALSPGSALFKTPPKWVMAAELVETTRLWAHVAARIRPEWAEDLAGHLVKRTYGEPFWDAGRGSALAHERVTLYGLPIVESRRVDYGRVDAVRARELFIAHALVRGEWQTKNPAIMRNRAMQGEVRALEDRMRRRDILVSQDELHDLYDARIGAEVVSGKAFDEWWAAAPRDLALTRADISKPVDTADFPDAWMQDDLSLRLTYQFEPGSQDDGVTVHVPLEVLNRVRADGFDWAVPGLREELVTALIRSLPKDVRARFIPVADHARRFLERARPEDGRLRDVLARELGVDGFGEIPVHLGVTFRVEGETGKDLDALKTRLRDRMRGALAKAFPDVSTTVDRVVRKHAVVAYPALCEDGSVGLFESEAAAWHAQLRATRRRIDAAPDDYVRCALNALVREPVWDDDSFRALQHHVRGELPGLVAEIRQNTSRIVGSERALRARLRDAKIPAYARDDIERQLSRLVHKGFVTATGAGRLPDVVRYLAAIERRLDKREGDPARDEALTQRIHALEARAGSDEVRWMIEELRVSFFAQQLGTAYKISEERILREMAGS